MNENDANEHPVIELEDKSLPIRIFDIGTKMCAQIDMQNIRRLRDMVFILFCKESGKREEGLIVKPDNNGKFEFPLSRIESIRHKAKYVLHVRNPKRCQETDRLLETPWNPCQKGVAS